MRPGGGALPSGLGIARLGIGLPFVGLGLCRPGLFRRCARLGEHVSHLGDCVGRTGAVVADKLRSDPGQRAQGAERGLADRDHLGDGGGHPDSELDLGLLIQIVLRLAQELVAQDVELIAERAELLL